MLAIVAVLACLFAAAADAGKRKGKRSDQPVAPLVCNPAAVNSSLPALPPLDVWRSSKRYAFPFKAPVKNAPGPVLWKKVSSALRATHYPAPNLPSCRIASRHTEDRSSKKAGQYTESPVELNGGRTYMIVDTFGRTMATLHWEAKSLIARHPERWGFYVGDKWAGHGALRAFEIQGTACKLAFDPVTAKWIRDPNYVMIAFNPLLGSSNKKDHPNQTGALKFRGFIERAALPGWANFAADRYDFGCGATALTPLIGSQTLGQAYFKSGYGPDKNSLVGQYFGETAATLNLLPGETKVHNNIPYDAYNPKPQFDGAMYAMINTTGVAGGGMVRGIVRAGADQFTLIDQMNYCDPNYTLQRMLLRRYGKRVSKWNYFAPATFSPYNAPTVRWVYGQIDPDPASVSPEAAAAAANPASVKLYAWVPIRCDR